MIDLHSHLLPGVDDGSPSVEVSVPVLRRFGEQGVEVLVCTPHLDASSARRAPFARHEEILETLRRSAPPKPALHLGWEIMLDVPGVDLTAPHLGLGGSSARLVEFPLAGVPRHAEEELFRLRMSGLAPLLAHPERYWGCTADRVRAWRHVGAAIQLDATMLFTNTPQAALARELLEEGLVDVMASDNHGDARSLAGARQWLVEIGAEEQAHLLTSANPERLLADLPVLPVAPIPRGRGLMERLKELVLGRAR